MGVVDLYYLQHVDIQNLRKRMLISFLAFSVKLPCTGQTSRRIHGTSSI
jgi:hypothetical protein